MLFFPHSAPIMLYRILLCFVSIVSFSLCLTGQTFQGKGGGITDYKGYFFRNLYPVETNDLPDSINCQFGLDKVCISIEHARISDLKVSLMAPDGSVFWLSNRNGGERGDRYDNTCFQALGFNGFIYEGTPPFRGEYIPDGLIERFNNHQNPNGYWYLIVEDLKTGKSGEVLSFSLTFSEDPMCPGQPKCDLENIVDCYCEGDEDSCKLLPDLVIPPELTQSSLKEFGAQHPNYPRQLRFGAGMANIGTGPLEIVGFGQWYCGEKLVEGEFTCPDGKKSQQRIVQNIYVQKNDQLSYKKKLAGKLYFDEKPGHDHYHAEGWVDYILLKKRWWTNDPHKWKVIGKSEKVSYCLMDSNFCQKEFGNCTIENKDYSRKNLPNFGLGGYAGCKQNLQGISVGGVDYYGTYYEGQFIQLPPDIENGQYYLYLVVDPQNQYVELDENNNEILIPVTLKKQ